MNKVLIGEGLDKIKFGMLRDEVKAILGEPNEIDEFEYEDSDKISAAWHYDELEISLVFDEEIDWQLINIAISNPEAEISGKKVVGMSLDEALKFIEAQKLGEAAIMEKEDNEEDADDDYKEVFVEDSNISFWFDENILTEIQWGPNWEE